MTSLKRGAIFAICLLTVLPVIAACSSEDARPFAGTRRTPAPQLTATLPTVEGDEFSFRADEGGILVVYFGYTSCPDVCPTTMADLSFATSELGNDADRVTVAMATVDPERDTETVLSSYVNSFVPGSIALRTEDDDQLAAAAADFGVFYEVSTLDDGSIDVAHSGTLFAVDARGNLTASWPFGTPSLDLSNDLATLLNEALEYEVS